MEVQSIRDFVAPELLGATFKLQNMPDTYKAGELAIELVGSKPESETGFHYRLDRTFQLVYFGANKLDCLTKMQAVERKINDKQMIPLGTRYLRIGSFSLSQSFKTETTGVYAVIGMLEAEIREARTQGVVNKVTGVETTIYYEGGQIDGD